MDQQPAIAGCCVFHHIAGRLRNTPGMLNGQLSTQMLLRYDPSPFGALPLMKSRLTALVIAGAVVISACAEIPTTNAPASLTRHGSIAFNAEAAEGNTYLVRFNGNGIPADFASNVQALGGEVIFAHEGARIAAIAGITEAGASGLAGRSDVAAVDADMETLLDNPGDMAVEAADETMSPAAPATAFFFPRQWNMRRINANAAWAAGRLGSATIRVGILDTGLDPGRHTDLAGRVDSAASRSFLSAAENARVTAAWGPGEPHWVDLHYHGTHVGATVASNANAAAGVTSLTRLVAIKVCAPGVAPAFNGTCPTSSVLAGILYAADIGLPVINMSLGGLTLHRFVSARGGNGPSFTATVNAVFHYAQKRGTQVVVASGNNGFDLQRDFGNGLMGLYCDAPGVICVSATGPTASSSVNGPWLNEDAVTSYSNVGKNHVTVAAPGGTGAGFVWAACSRRSIVLGCSTSNFIVGLTGTSMASPHVAGLAALIAAEGGHTPASITNRIIATADDLGPKGKDAGYGSGRINVFAGTQ